MNPVAGTNHEKHSPTPYVSKGRALSNDNLPNPIQPTCKGGKILGNHCIVVPPLGSVPFLPLFLCHVTSSCRLSATSLCCVGNFRTVVSAILQGPVLDPQFLCSISSLCTYICCPLPRLFSVGLLHGVSCLPRLGCLLPPASTRLSNYIWLLSPLVYSMSLPLPLSYHGS